MVAEVTMDDGFVDSSDEEDDMIDVGDLYHDEDEDEEEDEVEDSEDECNGIYQYNCNYQLFVYIFAMYKTYITFFIPLLGISSRHGRRARLEWDNNI